ncbi:MAG: hypothetical protein ACOYEV_14960 [Candidatus Nanopelagicales bacterium]
MSGAAGDPSDSALPKPPPRLRLDDPVRPAKGADSTAAWGERATGSADADAALAEFYRQATPPHHGSV